MRNLIFLLFLVFMTQMGAAQEPNSILFEEDWTLSQLIIEGNIIPIPSTEEISNVIVVFEAVGTDFGLYTIACNSIGTLTSEFTNEFFMTTGYNLLKNTCLLQSTVDFENYYRFDFYREDIQFSTFWYDIEELSNERLWLTITNEDGYTARYGNPEALNSPGFEIAMFSMLPNPVNDVLTIISDRFIDSAEVSIYDTLGKELHQTMGTQFERLEIDMSALPRGLYFIEVTYRNGSKAYERIIKD